MPYQYDVIKKATAGKPVDVKQGIYYGWKDRDFQKQENQIGTLKLEHDFNDNLTLSNTAVYGKSKIIIYGLSQMTAKVTSLMARFGAV